MRDANDLGAALPAATSTSAIVFAYSAGCAYDSTRDATLVAYAALMESSGALRMIERNCT